MGHKVSWKYHLIAIIAGLLVGFFVTFNIFFLAKVLPHGGL